MYLLPIYHNGTVLGFERYSHLILTNRADARNFHKYTSPLRTLQGTVEPTPCQYSTAFINSYVTLEVVPTSLNDAIPRTD